MPLFIFHYFLLLYGINHYKFFIYYFYLTNDATSSTTAFILSNFEKVFPTTN